MTTRNPGRPPAPDRARTNAARPPRRTTLPERDRTLAVPPAVRLRAEAAEPPEHLFRRLLSAYLGGAAAFEIEQAPVLSSGTREVAREFCRRTRRIEIVRDSAGLLELYDLEPLGAVDLDVLLERLGDLVLEVHRQAVDSWSRLPLGGDDRWSRRDDDVDREAWFLERCIARSDPGTRGRWEVATWTIARSLERIGDHAVTLGELGARLAELGSDGCLVREVRAYHCQAMEHLEQVLRSADGARANELLDVGEALVAGGRALSERLLPAVGGGAMSPASAAAVARAVEAVGRTVAYSQDIAQAFFDRGPGESPRTGVGERLVPVAAG